MLTFLTALTPPNEKEIRRGAVGGKHAKSASRWGRWLHRLVRQTSPYELHTRVARKTTTRQRT